MELNQRFFDGVHYFLEVALFAGYIFSGAVWAFMFNVHSGKTDKNQENQKTLSFYSTPQVNINASLEGLTEPSVLEVDLSVNGA